MLRHIHKQKQQTESDKIDKQYQKISKRSQRNQPRKSVKQMVKEYEENIIQPLLEFKDDYKPIPKPRNYTIKPPIEFQDKPVPKPRTKTTKKPAPYPRTKINFHAKTLKIVLNHLMLMSKIKLTL